jgi:pimeloyl-ACP methyl ester carboxylesterase
MKVEWSAAVDSNGMQTREFSLQGDRLITGALWLAKEPVAGRALICFGHGASGTRYQEPISNLAGDFTRAGYSCLSIDGPVHGLRKIGDGARGAFFPEFQRESSVFDMVSDWSSAIEASKALKEIGACDLAYFGWSMGSIFGIPLVASRQDFKVAAFGLVGVSEGFPHGNEILDAAAKIRCPVLFQMQLEDELFDRAGYLKVFDAFASRDKRIHANPGLHPEVPDEEVGITFGFMCDVLEGRRKPVS